MENDGGENGEFTFASGGAARRQLNGLSRIQTHAEKPIEVCHDDSVPTVRAQTIDELHSLQKKKSSPTTPARGTPRAFAAVSEEERQKLQMQSISASLASLTRETGPKVVRGDPATKAAESPRVAHVGHHSYAPSLNISDSALKFTHILCNLSPADNLVSTNIFGTELYEQAIKYEKGSFITSTGALATLSGAKTGRAPRDKRVVKDKTTEDELWWGKGSPNIEMDEHTFLVNRERAVDYLNSLDKVLVQVRLWLWFYEVGPQLRFSYKSVTRLLPSMVTLDTRFSLTRNLHLMYRHELLSSYDASPVLHIQA
ncbi:Phosphoenolpyruvate carboxykinase [ATP] [Morella rubra]|uniref:Phosphoenolpyruvate carboxykinase [ATP] n=1 Tax=Morella rubra TaxID=262757 RepID=A0A6A1UU07_9ROSI|nr:Phosphoenolpyruvate carboxykinase [ATP] [Morella rubra]